MKRLLGLLRATLPVAAGTIALVLGCAWLLHPGYAEKPIEHPPEKVAEAIAARAVTLDTANPPQVYQPVDYTQADAPWRPRHEAPVLAELVREGALPPVADRVGPEPLVLRGAEGNGHYGGTWVEYIATPDDLLTYSIQTAYAGLVRYSPQGAPIVPHLAKSWEVNADRTVFTFRLRRGVRWSDGHPWTARDILYWYEHEHNDPLFKFTPEEVLRHQGEIGRIVALDDYTIRISFSKPHGTFLDQAACFYGYILAGSPEHYRRKFHPRLGDRALIEATMRQHNLPDALELYKRLMDFPRQPTASATLQALVNPEHPRLWPWVPRRQVLQAPYVLVRNPYYFAVDSEGRQLPYIDRLVLQHRARELIGVAVSAGEVSLQCRFLDFSMYSLLMARRESGNFRVLHWYPADRSEYLLQPNLNRRIDPDDPASALKHRLLNEKTFRQALSLAIDRRRIVQLHYNGVGTPAQVGPPRESAFHHAPLLDAFVDYDPARAGALLDALGLERRDRRGFRVFPDGTPLQLFLHYSNEMDTDPLRLIVDDWAAVGIRATLRERTLNLWRTEVAGEQHDVSVGIGLNEFHPIVLARMLAPGSSWSDWARSYSRWYEFGGLFGDPRASSAPGAIEPPPGHPVREALAAHEQASTRFTLAEQAEAYRRVLEIAAENVWTINVSTPPPYLVVAHNNLRNVPEVCLASWLYFPMPGMAGPETFYFARPDDSPALAAQTKEQIRAPELDPRYRVGPGDAPQAGEDNGGSAGMLLRGLFGGVAALLILLLFVRHPFVLRRVAIMVPTLAVSAVATFVIVQLPPGDFLETRIIALEAQGGTAQEQIERLRALHHFDEPQWKRFARWSGLWWFTSFRAEDRGLLQGDLGLSMENEQRVNDLVGDRVTMTFVISLGTLLLVWAIALPIGIYSAVRQYSPGDYIATVLGFIGMCVPNFLLAVVLMFACSKYLGVNVTGLFSLEYAAASEWTWGKFVDLLKHIWVPIVVVAAGSLGAMIRTMRGNLLDELNKPYVVTARAKGMRPIPLLIKYPVRLALNPFVSNIGQIFPQLVSGVAIVAIVLSVPTVGGLLLQSLMAEDMYLAGSMLVVLSALGVFGTLVSDLLLLWLDPRIRLEGGAR